MNSPRPYAARLWSDKSLLLLCVVGTLLSVSYVLSTVSAFDDLQLPAGFSSLVSQYGYMKSIGTLFAGADLADQYRTYPLSRVLQFGMWAMVGSASLYYSLAIGLSQLGCAILLLLLLRELLVDEHTSLAVALVWLVSPFATNWCFHHYSYLLFPFQLVIATCFILGHIARPRYRYAMAALLGACCALTGELQLIAGPAALLLVAIASRDGNRLRASWVAICAMVATVIGHRWLWTSFVQDVSRPQRYDVKAITDPSDLLQRTYTALASVPHSALDQVHEILGSGFMWGALAGSVLAFAYWMATAATTCGKEASSEDVADVESAPGRNFAVAGALLLMVLLSIAVYIAVSALAGQAYSVMPRRYGFVPLTMLLIACITAIVGALRTSGVRRRLPLAVAVGLVGLLAGELHLGGIPDARAVDRALERAMREARDQGGTSMDAKKGVLFFVSSQADYLSASATNYTVGPAIQGWTARELYQSPLANYWTAQYFSRHSLGFQYAAMPKQTTDAGTIEVGGNPYPNGPGEIRSQDVVVVANLGCGSLETPGKKLGVFKSFDEFAPHFFGCRIDREPLNVGTVPLDEFAIDMGHTSGISKEDPRAMPDKKYDTVGPISTDWIESYGLLSGQDTVYAHPNVSRNLPYYRTNRNGAFTYGVSFRHAGSVEISLDFWEQWGRQIGERVFDLEVSWDGSTWASIGPIDPASINGQRPFSIVLVKRGPSAFQFRMKPTATSKDIPMIQGLRIRRLPA